MVSTSTTLLILMFMEERLILAFTFLLSCVSSVSYQE